MIVLKLHLITGLTEVISFNNFFFIEAISKHLEKLGIVKKEVRN